MDNYESLARGLQHVPGINAFDLARYEGIDTRIIQSNSKRGRKMERRRKMSARFVANN
jgi:hypothetical protein